jgi:hypothetical protein
MKNAVKIKAFYYKRRSTGRFINIRTRRVYAFHNNDRRLTYWQKALLKDLGDTNKSVAEVFRPMGIEIPYRRPILYLSEGNQN